MDPAIQEPATISVKTHFPKDEQINDFNAWKVFWSDLMEDIQRYSEPIHFPVLTHLYELSMKIYGSIKSNELKQEVVQLSIDAEFVTTTGNLLQSLLQDDLNQERHILYLTIGTIHLNHSDLNRNYCEALCNDKNTLNAILYFFSDDLENNDSRARYVQRELYTGIVGNILRNHTNCRQHFTDKESVFQAFAYMMNVADWSSQLAACIGLSFIVNETHKNIHMECIQTVDNVALNLLNQWKSHDQSGRIDGFSFIEILQGIEMLLNFDLVRKYFYKHRHAIHLVKQLWQSEREEEVLWSIRVIVKLINEKHDEFLNQQQELYELINGMRGKFHDKSDEFQLIFKEIENVYG